MAKTLFFRAGLIWSATAALAWATPDQVVKVSERLLGSHAAGYVTLRTEIDNLGNYYSSRTKRFLVEYSKQPADAKYESSPGAELKVHLLLDTTATWDGSELAPMDLKTKVNARDESVKLAEILERFPNHAQRWDAGKFARLSSHPESGTRLGKTELVWGGWVRRRFIGEEEDYKLEWKLDEVLEDENCLYLSVSTEELGQRLVCIPPRKTTQVRDQLAKQPVYIVAGHSGDKEQAMTLARDLLKKTDGKFKPEVWTCGHSAQKTIYVVADAESNEHLGRFQFEAMEKLTGMDLGVMSSDDFTERTPVDAKAGANKKE